MPSMEQLLNQIPTEIRLLQDKPWWISKLDLEYSYGQMNLFKERSEHCDFASNGKKREQTIQVEKKSTVYPISRQYSEKNTHNLELPNTRVAR